MVLGWIVTLLGWIVSLILTVLLAFAKYNSFSSAAPVEVGWPIVRDICNMFFIVILLISAFSTIIDYGGGELHYTKVLPRLLMMAVLINFSKTLIQLLIDFSQVVMLTFVNAFASAAQGNFVNALGLARIMQLSADAPAGAANGTNIIIAYMLAIFMLGIMISVVTIMTGFLIFRIVGLWIALIMSPLAFFVTAIPGKLSKHLGSIANDYWSRLGTLLTGGPVMAFFLWLTLAVVQGANSGGGGLASALSFDVPEGAATFITSIGDAQSIASFIVGITLLMMGLDQAVKSASAISKTLGGFAEKAKGAGMSLGRLGATAPFLAAGYGAAYGARGAARYADKRLDLTRKVSAAGLQTLGRVPVVGSALRPTLAKGLTMRRDEAAKQAKEAADLMAGVGKTGTDAELRMVGKTFGMGTSAFRTLGARAGSAKVAEILSSDDLRDREAKRNKTAFIDDIKKRNPGISEDEAKAGSDVMSKEAANREQAKYVRSQLALAKTAGDTGKVESLEKYMKTNPHLADPEAPYIGKDGKPVEGKNGRDKYIEDLATDPDLYKEVGKLDAMNGEVATGFMLKHGWAEVDKERKDADGNVIKYKSLEQKDKAAWDRVKGSVQKSGNKDLLNGLNAHEGLVTESPTTDYRDLKKVQHRFNAGDGMTHAYSVDPAAVPGKGGARIRNEGERESISKLQEAAKQGAGYTVPVEAARTALRSGASFAEVAKITESGKDNVSSIVDSVVKESVGQAAQTTNEADFNDEIKNMNSVFRQIDAQGVTSDHQIKIVHAALTGGIGQLLSKENYPRIASDQRAHVVKLLAVAKQRVNDLKQQDISKMKAEDQKIAKEIIDSMAALEREAAKNKDSNIPSGAVKQILRKDVVVE
ncbi:hypothetical protein K8R04_02400 [Candidatus Uhrbacteria bacterium]|nr:hypothetical protein [Candidatus Uhrbacteria bacterium]